MQNFAIKLANLAILQYTNFMDQPKSQLMSKKNFELTFNKDINMPNVGMHSHDFYELYYFQTGDALYTVENGHYILEPGDILLISPTNLHRLDIQNPNIPYQRIVLWLDPRFIDKLSSSKTNLHTCFKESEAQKAYLIRDKYTSTIILDHLKNLYSLNQTKEFGYDLESENIIRSILICLAKYTTLASPTKFKYAEQNQFITQAIDYINTHLTEDLSLESIANALYINKYYFSHMFKAETNTSPHTYILKKRLLLSKTLISSGLSISNACIQSGFDNDSHFFRAFKQEFGLTPKQYYSLIKN